MSNKHPTPEAVVAAFNVLGYSATFAAVARTLKPAVPAQDLYRRFPSREALAQAWLSTAIPEASDEPGLAPMFTGFMFSILARLESQRDFSRAWLASLKVTAPLHLPQFEDFHRDAHKYFADYLDLSQAQLSLPSQVQPRDVVHELADALCVVASWLVLFWEADRSVQYHHTRCLVESTACLIDALLVRREAFGDVGLLFHLHQLLRQPHEQFLKPLLGTLLSPDRVQRYANPVQLIEALRSFGLPAEPAS